MSKRNSFIYFLFFVGLSAQAETTVIPSINVTAKKNSQTLSPHSPKTIITQQQISNAGVMSLSQALSELGGIQLQDTTGNGSQVMMSLRGFGTNASSNTLLLINGIPLTNPDIAPPDLNAIPLHSIQFIEIIAGSESVLYGDQAVGGIINIVTQNPTQKKLEASCSAGSYNQYNCYIGANNQYERLHYSIAALTNHSDNYRDHNDYDQTLLLGSANLLHAYGQTNFDYKIANEYMQYPGALTAAQVRENRRQANNDIDYFRDLSGDLHLSHLHQITTNWQSQTDLSFREMSGHGVLTSAFDQSRTTYFIKPQLKGNLYNAIIKSGIDFQHDQYHLNSLYGITDEHQQKYGLFGLADIPFKEKLIFSLGARGAQQNSKLESFTENNDINRAFAANIGATYLIHPDLKFYLRRAGNYRFPKADENAFTAPGVTSLRTQRGESYESGLQWEMEQAEAKVGIYQLNLRDEIAFDPTQTPQTPFGSNRNLDPTVRRGFSVSGRESISSRIAIGGQYNFVNARFQSGVNEGNRIPLVSENIFRTNIDYTITQHWGTYAEAVYTGNQYAANDDGNVAGKLGGYTVYNFNLRYRYEQLSATFRLNNIFNKYYYLYTVYNTGQPETFYPAQGRNVVLTVNYLF